MAKKIEFLNDYNIHKENMKDWEAEDYDFYRSILNDFFDENTGECDSYLEEKKESGSTDKMAISKRYLKADSIN